MTVTSQEGNVFERVAENPGGVGGGSQDFRGTQNSPPFEVKAACVSCCRCHKPSFLSSLSLRLIKRWSGVIFFRQVHCLRGRLGCIWWCSQSGFEPFFANNRLYFDKRSSLFWLGDCNEHSSLFCRRNCDGEKSFIAQPHGHLNV